MELNMVDYHNDFLIVIYDLISTCNNTSYRLTVGGNTSMFNAALQMALVLLVQFLCMVYYV
jgi:hypothetical protein